MDVAQGELNFPERTVVMARASVEQMERSMVTLNSIAELRRPKETANFFDSMERDEQADWLDDLLKNANLTSIPWRRRPSLFLDVALHP